MPRRRAAAVDSLAKVICGATGIRAGPRRDRRAAVRDGRCSHFDLRGICDSKRAFKASGEVTLLDGREMLGAWEFICGCLKEFLADTVPCDISIAKNGKFFFLFVLLLIFPLSTFRLLQFFVILFFVILSFF